MTLTNKELRNIINMAWDAVDASKAGPVYSTTTLGMDGKPAANIVGLQTFQSVLQCILPKGVVTHNVQRDKEPWQQDE